MNNARTPILENNFRTAFALSSGPLSGRIGSGGPRSATRSAKSYKTASDAECHVADWQPTPAECGAGRKAQGIKAMSPNGMEAVCKASAERPLSDPQAALAIGPDERPILADFRRFPPIFAVWQSERLRSGLGEKATTCGTAHLFRSTRAVQFEMVEPTGFWERPDRAAKSLNFGA
jgi:hypothetical protein